MIVLVRLSIDYTIRSMSLPHISVVSFVQSVIAEHDRAYYLYILYPLLLRTFVDPSFGFGHMADDTCDCVVRMI